jgi:radical SAM protein (TIGR01212 family)
MMAKNNNIKRPFNNYSRYLKQKYGCSVYRVAVDAGFSCPHRGIRREKAGCTFCDQYGSRAPYLQEKTSLREQITGTLAFLTERYQAKEFILYFQAFSNTNAPVEKLRSIYDEGLALAPFKELIVSTRPDCIDEEKAALLAAYQNKERDVWVELGLQSAHDTTLKLINRGHTAEDFVEAFKLLKKYRLKVTAHLIFGLPGEGMKEIVETVKFIAALKPDGLKIHNLHLLYNSELFSQYEQGEISIPCSKTHMEYVIKALALLPPSTVIMRLTCDTPRSRLAAPRVFLSKQEFNALLLKEMLSREIHQGDEYAE